MFDQDKSTRCLTNLAHRLRRWPNIGQTSGRFVVFAGLLFCNNTSRNIWHDVVLKMVPRLPRWPVTKPSYSQCLTLNHNISHTFPANTGHSRNAVSMLGQRRRRCVKQLWVNPANTKHLYSICTMLVQRRRRWADVLQMLYKCFVFAGNAPCLLGCQRLVDCHVAVAHSD